MRIPLRGAWIAAFILLSLLSLGFHELIHHLTARATCGEWGSMTFYTFHLAEGCEPAGANLFATLAGPVLTYALMYAGLALIHGGRRLAGTTLILANLPLAGFVTVLMRGGDEMVLGRAWIGGEAAWPVLMAITVLLLAPPVIGAWRSIGNRRRGWLFAALLILPLFVDMLIKRVVLSSALAAWPADVVGIPWLFVAYMAVAGSALLWLVSRGVLSERAPAAAMAPEFQQPGQRPAADAPVRHSPGSHRQ